MSEGLRQGGSERAREGGGKHLQERAGTRRRRRQAHHTISLSRLTDRQTVSQMPSVARRGGARRRCFASPPVPQRTTDRPPSAPLTIDGSLSDSFLTHGCCCCPRRPSPPLSAPLRQLSSPSFPNTERQPPPPLLLSPSAANATLPRTCLLSVLPNQPPPRPTHAIHCLLTYLPPSLPSERADGKLSKNS